MAKHSKVCYIQRQQIFQHSAFVTLWFFTYISALRTRNLGRKRSISNSLQMSINVLLKGIIIDSVGDVIVLFCNIYHVSVTGL